MPSRTWPIWVLSGLLLLGLPTASFIYWPLVLGVGALSPEGDSIGIPLFGSVLIALALAPFVLGTAWFCLRRNNPEARFATWRPDRPIRSWVATLILCGAASSLALLLFLDSLFDWPWYEHLWTGYGLLWIWWFLVLRAALIDQLSADEAA